jgi:hypothetical protein
LIKRGPTLIRPASLLLLLLHLKLVALELLLCFVQRLFRLVQLRLQFLLMLQFPGHPESNSRQQRQGEKKFHFPKSRRKTHTGHVTAV